jgi:hypothetical protein
VQKALISSPAEFVGQFSHAGLLIAHASPTSPRQVNTHWYGEGTVHARCFLAAVFETPPLPPSENENPRLIPSYAWVGDTLCMLLAVLFGKRIDDHGFLERHGMFSLPRIEALSPIFYREFPFNSNQARADLGIPLNLVEVGRLGGLLDSTPHDPDAFEVLLRATRFYLRAIRSFQDDPELAFLDLITCGEVLAGSFHFGDDELYDPATHSLLNEMRATCPGGDKKVDALKGRLRQAKRRFVLSLLELLDESFFSRTEAKEDWCRLTRDGIEKRLKAAYDLRSYYLHEGLPFAQQMIHLKCLNEVPVGQSVLTNREWAIALDHAPSFLGMERIVRYCLLRFLHLRCTPIDCRLSDPGVRLREEAQ